MWGGQHIVVAVERALLPLVEMDVVLVHGEDCGIPHIAGDVTETHILLRLVIVLVIMREYGMGRLVCQRKSLCVKNETQAVNKVLLQKKLLVDMGSSVEESDRFQKLSVVVKAIPCTMEIV